MHPLGGLWTFYTSKRQPALKCLSLDRILFIIFNDLRLEVPARTAPLEDPRDQPYGPVQLFHLFAARSCGVFAVGLCATMGPDHLRHSIDSVAGVFGSPLHRNTLQPVWKADRDRLCAKHIFTGQRSGPRTAEILSDHAICQIKSGNKVFQRKSSSPITELRNIGKNLYGQEF